MINLTNTNGKRLPRGFCYGVLLEDNRYYASLFYEDFSIIRTGTTDDSYELCTPFIYSGKVKPKPTSTDPDEINKVTKKFLDHLHKSSSYVCTLSEDMVKILKKRASMISGNDSVFHRYNKTKRKDKRKSKVLFKPTEENKSIIEFDVVKNPNETYFFGISESYLPLEKAELDKTIELECSKMKYLPNGELTVTRSDDGLLSFYSNKAEEAVHFKSEHFTVT